MTTWIEPLRDLSKIILYIVLYAAYVAAWCIIGQCVRDSINNEKRIDALEAERFEMMQDYRNDY